MIKRKVRLKITAASSQIVRLGDQGLRALCPDCEREVEMIMEAEVRRILQMDALALASLVEAGTVHVVQTVNSHLWFCKDSLFQSRR